MPALTLALVVVSLMMGIGLVQAASAPPASATSYLYEDSFEWSNWSWNTTTSAASSPVLSGSGSLQVQFTSRWAGLQFHKSGFDSSPYSHFEFGIRPNGAVPKLTVRAYDGSGSSLGSKPAASYTTSLGDGWYWVSVPLADLSAEDTAVSRMVIQEGAGTIPSYFTVDAVRFASTDSPPPSLEKAIYDDTLHLSNWSWGTTLDLSVTSPKYADQHSMEVTYSQPWAGASFHTAGIDLTPYNSITLKLYAPGNPQLKMQVTDNAGTTGPGVALSAYATPLGGGWSDVAIPISELRMTGKTMTRVTIQEAAGAVPSSFYVDNLMISGDEGSAPVPTPTPTPDPSPAPGELAMVYDEHLRWSNWSWSASLDPSVGSPTFAGSHSLGISFSAGWAGASFHDSGLDLSPYTKVTFAIYAPENPTLRLYLNDGNGGKSVSVPVAPYATPSSTSGWSEVTVPLADLGMTGKTATRLTIQEGAGRVLGTFYIDNLRFEAGDVPPPPPTPPPPSGTTKWLASFGDRGTDAGGLNIPRGIAIGPNNDVYVADTFNDRIQVFNARGEYLRQWPTSGSVWDLAVDKDGFVYALTPATNVVRKYTSTGTQVTTWGSGAGSFAFPTGIALDSAGNVYVADTFNNRIGKYTKDGGFIRQFGFSGDGNGQFREVRSVAVDGAGNIFALDSGNNRVQKIAPDGTYLTQWGTVGWADGQFAFPTDIAVDAAGNVYVADYENIRIQMFTNNGQFVAKYGVFGYGEGRLRFPRSLAVHPDGTIYVANSNSDSIEIWGKAIPSHTAAPPLPPPAPEPPTPSYYVRQWGTPGQGPGEFNFPRGVAVGQDGKIYVADTFNDRVQVFTEEGTFIDEFKTNVWRAWSVAVIAVDSADNAVYVAAPDSHSIKKFSLTGEHLFTIGGQGSAHGKFSSPFDMAVDKDGFLYVADTFNSRVEKFDKNGNYVRTFGHYGTGQGQFISVRSVAVDDDGNIYVLDSDNGRVQVLAPNGTFIRQFGSPGSGPGQFGFSTGIAVDGDANVYVSDYDQHRIVKFSSNGTYVGQFGGFGFEKGEIRFARGLAVAPDGTLYVADSVNDRIQVFR